MLPSTDEETEVHNIYFICLFWLHCVAHRSLVPRPGIEPGPAALGAWRLNHWTSREVSKLRFREGSTLAFTVEGPGSIPGGGTKIPQAVQYEQKERKKERNITETLLG